MTTSKFVKDLALELGSCFEMFSGIDQFDYDAAEETLHGAFRYVLGVLQSTRGALQHVSESAREAVDLDLDRVDAAITRANSILGDL